MNGIRNEICRFNLLILIGLVVPFLGFGAKQEGKPRILLFQSFPQAITLE